MNKSWTRLEKNVDSELDVAGGSPRVLLSRGIPLEVSSGSDIVLIPVATKAPELRSLVLGTILVFSVLKGISCLILVEAEKLLF